MNGHYPTGRVLIFDDDHYYMGSVIAEKLIDLGCRVDFVSTYSNVAAWTRHTVEQERIQARLINLGVNIIPSRNLKAFDGNRVTLECVYTGSEEEMQGDGLVLITARVPNDGLYYGLSCSGHKFAREFDEHDPRDVPFKREINVLGL